MHTNSIKVIWLTIGQHLPGSDLVVSDFNVSRNGEAGAMTRSVQHPTRFVLKTVRSRLPQCILRRAMLQSTASQRRTR